MFLFSGFNLIRIGEGIQGNVGIVSLLGFEDMFIYFLKKIVVDNSRRELLISFLILVLLINKRIV